ncbi:MAG: alpha/beta hydrolase [Planctomycetota bacterium]|nr:alpha/beta hydrolase [Planctomycetota bacterium]
MEAQVNGVTLHYEVAGAGRAPMLLLHGNGEDHHIFDKIIPKLSSRFTVYAIDSRNHGLSQKTDVYSYQTMADDIYVFIEALHLGEVGVIGFSDGAIVGLILALSHGRVIRKMALLGLNLQPGDFRDECRQYIEETYAKTRDPLFKMMMEQPSIALDEIRSISIPTLLVAAENDIYKPDTFTKIAAALPNAELKIMTGHDHGSYIMGQDLMYDDFIRFFR